MGRESEIKKSITLFARVIIKLITTFIQTDARIKRNKKSLDRAATEKITINEAS